MGRKRKALAPDADGILRTGVYRRRVVRPKLTPAEQDAAFDATREALGRPQKSIRQWLDEYRRGLGDSIRPHVDAVTWDEYRQLPGRNTLYPLDLGDGQRTYVFKSGLPTETAEAVRDAIDAINEIRVLERRIGADDSLVGSLAFVVNAAWKLGRAQERSIVRQFEPLVRESLARKPGQRAGAAVVNADHTEQWTAYQTAVDDCMANGMSYEKASAAVGRKLGVSAKTIKRHTTNPKPRNRGRHGKVGQR